MRIGANLTSPTTALYGTDELALFLGAVPGSWTHRLIELYQAADMANRRRIGAGFPALIVIHETWNSDYPNSDHTRSVPPTAEQLETALISIYGTDWRAELNGAHAVTVPAQRDDEQ